MKEQKPFGRNSTVVIPGQTVPAESLPWNPHSNFVGVFLRHLVTGKDTRGRLGLHHVRIDPGCSIGDHATVGQVETHDVLADRGNCMLAGTVIPCNHGVVGIMLSDLVNRIKAGDKGLLLLANACAPTGIGVP